MSAAPKYPPMVEIHPSELRIGDTAIENRQPGRGGPLFSFHEVVKAENTPGTGGIFYRYADDPPEKRDRIALLWSSARIRISPRA